MVLMIANSQSFKGPKVAAYTILFNLFKVHIYTCIHIYMYSWYHFSHLDYYKILTRISTYIQYIFVYPFYI